VPAYAPGPGVVFSHQVMVGVENVDGITIIDTLEMKSIVNLVVVVVVVVVLHYFPV
jgi:hypothetical protein